MSTNEEIRAHAMAESRDPRTRWIMILLGTAALTGLVVAIIASWFVWRELTNDAQAGRNLAQEVQVQCQDPSSAKELGDLCDKAEDIKKQIEEGPAGPQGNQGPVGPPGPQGPTGPRGLQGPAGKAGDAGLPGPTGRPGPRGQTGATGSVGPVGDAGPIGPTGEKGNPGEKGEQGLKGDQGDRGPQGIEGPVGPQGVEGPIGPQGPQGVPGIVNVVTAPGCNDAIPDVNHALQYDPATQTLTLICS